VAHHIVHVEGEHPQADAELRGGQPRATFVAHRLDQVADQPAQLLVEVDDGVGGRAKHRIAALSASPAALAEFLAALRLPDGADVLGPVPEPYRPGAAAPEGERERYLVRVPRSDGVGLARALHEVQGVRSARKGAEYVRVQLDPLELA
jgi:hypothetical protein